MHLLGSLADNQICGIDNSGRGTYTAEGINALCEALKDNNTLTSLKYAIKLEPISPLTASDTQRAFLPVCLLLRSLAGNDIGVEGCKVITAVLDKTQIKSLKCASRPAKRSTFAWTLCPRLSFEAVISR